MGGVPDLELGRMDAHGESAGPGRDVVPGKGPLATFIQSPVRRNGQRMGRDDHALPHGRSDRWGHCVMHGYAP